MCGGVGFNKPYVWEATRGGEGIVTCIRERTRQQPVWGEGEGAR